MAAGALSLVPPLQHRAVDRLPFVRAGAIAAGSFQVRRHSASFTHSHPRIWRTHPSKAAQRKIIPFIKTSCASRLFICSARYQSLPHLPLARTLWAPRRYPPRLLCLTKTTTSLPRSGNGGERAMPALSSSPLMSTTVNQALLDRNVSDVYEQGIEVVCAWPVSGQYGPGSRILYYVLIAACVLARKAEWIKNACLAAALLFPAVAALHGIALAAFHRDGAVDLDIYGAFQLCAIGILAAPVTVRLSRTYFNDPGRNAIFLWAGLILAGLLGLTVEFYRAVPTTCYMDDQGRALSGDPHDFPYDAQPACNMTCNTSPAGPQSPMRGGAANNIYLIPAPSKLSFGTGTLLCATCCVHAILWLASMMDKILEINWKSRFGINDDIRSEPIKGTNGATVGKMNDVNEIIRFFISVAIVPIFTAAGLAVLIVGEINFFSYQMRYQNEPMASIGQWGPIVGTGIAIVGSLYLLLAADIEAALHGPSDNEKGCEHECPKHSSHAPTEEQILPPSHSLDETDTVDETLRSFSRDKGGRLKGKINGLSVTGNSKTTSAHGLSGSRRKAADALIAWSGLLGQVTHDSFDLSKFRDGAALDFPEIPGEKERNRNLAHVKELYSKRLQADGTPAVQASRSRASSFIEAGPSGCALEPANSSSDPPSPWPARRAHPSPSPAPSSSRLRASMPPAETSSRELSPISPLPMDDNSSRGRGRERRDTLEVPVAARLRPTETRHLQALDTPTHPVV